MNLMVPTKGKVLASEIGPQFVKRVVDFLPHSNRLVGILIEMIFTKKFNRFDFTFLVF